MQQKRIITAAVTGGDSIPSQSPYLPITPKEIADEAVRCAEAGASVVHIHARDPDTGQPSSRLDLFEEIICSIKERSDAVICPSTGGNVNMGIEERMAIIPNLKPEMATFNMGSMNYTIHFLAESFKRRGKSFKYDWEKEYVESSKNAVFQNTFADLESIVGLMNENDVKPECEVYDLGMLYNAAYLVDKGLLKKPIQIQFVLGVLGGARADIEVLQFLKQIADKLFNPLEITWSVVGAGYPQEFILGAQAVLMGGNLRVGMEDNFKVSQSRRAESNAELVEKAVNIIRSLDCEVASPEEARKILNLKDKEK